MVYAERQMNKKIIPCLDIKDGQVVKGKKFKNIQNVAEPVSLAKKYEADGADILFLLDITGSDRNQFLQIVENIRQSTTLPLYVGGGIRTIEDAEATLTAGATKVAITSAAIDHPELLSHIARQFGSDKLILSIDAKRVDTHTWHAFTQGGRKDAELDVIEWAVRGEQLGASEILLNSIDADGVKDGYDIALNQAVTNAVTIPVIASGGAGTIEHFQHVLTEGGAHAALAASVFHYDEINISTLKQALQNEGIIGEK